MNRSDRRRWQAARTLPELADLTALWLEGALASQPGYAANHGPDRETRALIPVLARLNRAGWLTEVSQPGWGPGPGFDGATWCQRAGVGGFARPALAEHIATTAIAAGLIVIRYRGTGWRSGRHGAIVSMREDVPTCGFGNRWTRRELASRYAEWSREAMREVRQAVQLTVVDPEWGRTDLLWSVLEAAIDKVDLVA